MTSLSPKEFIKFLKDNEILTAVIAALISSQAADLANSFLDNIFLPIISSDTNKDGKPDIDKLKKYSINFGNNSLGIGKVIISLIRFIFILFIIYLLSKYLMNKDSSNFNLNWKEFIQ